MPNPYLSSPGEDPWLGHAWAPRAYRWARCLVLQDNPTSDEGMGHLCGRKIMAAVPQASSLSTSSCFKGIRNLLEAGGASIRPRNVLQ
jgi:hypothetical protein